MVLNPKLLCMIPLLLPSPFVWRVHVAPFLSGRRLSALRPRTTGCILTSAYVRFQSTCQSKREGGKEDKTLLTSTYRSQVVGGIVRFCRWNAASQEAVVDSVERCVQPGLHVAQPYSIVSSTLALSIRILSSRRAPSRSYSSRVYFPETAPCVAYAPVDFDGHIGIVVDALPEVYALIRMAVDLADYFYAEYGGGPRDPYCL